jgi:glycosyltransferase involved in cell wall biosynthesis
VASRSSANSPARPRYSQSLRRFVDEAPLERRSLLEFVAAAAASLPAGSRIADVGAGSAPFRELFEHVEYVTVDRAESLHGDAHAFDVVASAEAIPLATASLDAVLCTQVLEHLPEPADALKEFGRLLRDGGQLFLTAPLAWEEHETPHDYYRYTRSGLEHLLLETGFEGIEIAGRTDCFTTLAQLLRNARWSLGEAEDAAGDARRAAFVRLEEISDELLELAPLDQRHKFPLGYRVVARRPPRDGVDAGDQPAILPRTVHTSNSREAVLYLAPWVDLGGSDKGTIDWFKHIDRERWDPSIITTQPSDNRWLEELEPFAREIWSLPDLMPGSDFPAFILGFIETRGVKIVHIMNSRLGFDLLPDMRCLAHPPSVVVQLHAEEHDRTGYVRYVASRYGDLVDAFSVTSQQLADAILDYNVPRSHIHVIKTGVDARNEFSPDAVAPFDLPGQAPRILWPGRLVAQKDPMLTLDVVKALDTLGANFTLDVVGDGDLKSEVMDRAEQLDVAHLISWHPPSHEMPRWYRSSDLVLMTSVFEGVPYVLYEALAMKVPVVAPALPGNVELLGRDCETLIAPRDDVEAYASVIERLLANSSRRRELGRLGRELMLEQFSLEEMGRGHDALYEQLLTHQTISPRQGEEDPTGDVQPEPAPPLALPRNPPPPRTVAVIVPCHEHGRFLPEAIQSLYAQTLRPRRIIVVDDASVDRETTTVLDRLEGDPLVAVIRLAVNSGPSVARNRALDVVEENYVLPLDADDRLPPSALEDMLDQLEQAPESVGFIYPKVQHFGNRHDYYDPPAYNLNALLRNNYCAAASLFDARIFRNGMRYAEEIVFGHEDWDLVLQMAERGVIGEAAKTAVLQYRKRGFSRAKAVEYGPDSFYEATMERHPILYQQQRDKIKAQWSPALSVLLTRGCDGVNGDWPDNLWQQLEAQSCNDFEVIINEPSTPHAPDLPLVKVSGEGTIGVANALAAAGGRFVLLTGTRAASALCSPGAVEQLIRIFWSNYQLPHFVLGQVAQRRGPRLGLLSPEEVAGAAPLAVAWRRTARQSIKIETGAAETLLEDILLHWLTEGAVTWRAL